MIVSFLVLLDVCSAQLLYKLSREYRAVSLQSKRAVSSIQGLEELTLQNNVSYYRTQLKIGNPPQAVNVQIDTGSSDLWVPSRSNPYCDQIGCAEGETFNDELSTSFRRNDDMPRFEISYKDDTFASGIYGRDDVRLGGHDDQNELVIHDANFAVAKATNSSEAVLGIGLTSTESMVRFIDQKGITYPQYANIPVQMKQQGLIESISYSLWLNDREASEGMLLFGGVDHAKYIGDLRKVPIVKTNPQVKAPTSLSIMMHGIKVFNSLDEDSPLLKSSVAVLLDSGTTYCQLPRQIIDAIAQAFGAEYDEQQDLWLVSETQKKKRNGGGLRFELSGIEIDVSIDELLIPVGPLVRISRLEQFSKLKQKAQDPSVQLTSRTRFEKGVLSSIAENYYFLGMFAIDDDSDDTYILGDSFLRSAYVVFDLENKEIALANTASNTTESEIEAINSKGIPSAKKASWYSATKQSPHIVVYNGDHIFNGGSQILSAASSTDLWATSTSHYGATSLIQSSTSSSPSGHKRQSSKPGHKNDANGNIVNLHFVRIAILASILISLF